MSLTERVARAMWGADNWAEPRAYTFDAEPEHQRRRLINKADAAIREVLAEVRRAATLHVEHAPARVLVDSVHGLMLARFEQGKPLAPEEGE